MNEDVSIWELACLKGLHSNPRILKFSRNHRHTLQFNSNRRWQAVDAHRRSARLIFLELFGVNTVERMKITFHIGQKYRHIYQVFPAGAAGFEYRTHIAEHGMHLRFEIETRIIP